MTLSMTTLFPKQLHREMWKTINNMLDNPACGQEMD